jgi:hypothetical protein
MVRIWANAGRADRCGLSGVSVVLADPRTPYADRREPLLQGLRALRKVVMMIEENPAKAVGGSKVCRAVWRCRATGARATTSSGVLDAASGSPTCPPATALPAGRAGLEASSNREGLRHVANDRRYRSCRLARCSHWLWLWLWLRCRSWHSWCEALAYICGQTRSISACSAAGRQLESPVKRCGPCGTMPLDTAHMHAMRGLE